MTWKRGLHEYDVPGEQHDRQSNGVHSRHGPFVGIGNCVGGDHSGECNYVFGEGSMNLEKVEKYRRAHPLGFAHKAGDDFGWFEIPTKIGGPILRVMVAPTDEEWQHVSVSLAHRCPTWEEMCRIKALFWTEDETVVQFHPPKSDYINNHKYCLHLWCLKGREIPRPPSVFVGFN